MALPNLTREAAVERDGGDRVEGLLTGGTGTVGEIQFDAVVVDGDQGRAFDGRLAGQVGKCHAPQPIGREGTSS
ncbi:hypothetical protein, partial [Mycolicibacterium monacense]|uniref:hypothetical protein n=1 Tax=Mycolicibacterium monacense TaxID=85693 RepID=UPI000AC66134